MINGKPRHSQSQGSVERANQDIERMLNAWKTDNKRKDWSKGLRYVQYAKNQRKHSGIGVSPFEAQMGFKALLGVDCLRLDSEILEGITEEHELDALFGKESDVSEEDISTDWKIIMEEKVKSLKEEYSQLNLQDRNSREGNRIKNQINYIYENMAREPILPSTVSSNKVQELKKHLSEKLLSLDPVIARLEAPEPTAKIPKAPSKKTKKTIKSIVKPNHVSEIVENPIIPEVAPIAPVGIDDPSQVFDTYENDLELTIMPAIDNNNTSPPAPSIVPTIINNNASPPVLYSESVEIDQPSQVFETYENDSEVSSMLSVEIDDSVLQEMDIVSYLCNSCSHEISSVEMATAVCCLECNVSCHLKCLTDTRLCKICERQANIKNIRKGVKRKMVKQADYMKERSERQFAPAQLYDTVLVPIPNVDKAKLESSNLLGIVLEISEDCNQFKIGTRSGVLEGLYHRNHFQDSAFLN